MKFDYVVGNPPYQYNKDVNPNKKLYIDITIRILPVLKSSGTMMLITPVKIFVNGNQNTVYKTLKNCISIVDYSANNYFNIGQKVFMWKYTPRINPHESLPIKIIEEDLSERIIHEFDDICELHHRVIHTIMKKLSYKTNGKPHMNICHAANKHGVLNSKLSVTRRKDTNVEVLCNTVKDSIKYCSVEDSPKKRLQLVIPYVGRWQQGSTITNTYTNSFFFVSKLDETLETLKNMKIYMDSKIIAYCVMNRNILYPSGFYDFLYQLSAVDLSKEWSDEELYKEFNLDEQEIKEVEEWYSEWSKTWKKEQI